MGREIDDLLMRYSSGQLDAGLSLVVSSYVSMEPEARQKLEQYEELNAALLEYESPVELSDEALDTLLELLDKPENLNGPSKKQL